MMFKVEEKRSYTESAMNALLEIIFELIISSKGDGNYYNNKSFH